MTTLALSPDRTRETSDLTIDLALDLSVVTIELMVSRDISAYTERNRRGSDRTPERGAR